MDTAQSHGEYQYVADLYDSIVPYRDRADVGFFVEAALTAQGQVLEIGCGTGRVLIPTARTGKEITGLDLSSRMIDVCQRSLAAEPDEVQQRVQLVQADMRDFELGRQFGLITMPFRPFQHMITVEDQLACLAAVRHHLRADGAFILDVFNPSIPFLADASKLEEGDEAEFATPDGRRVLARSRIVSRDYANQVQNVELIYYVTHPDGRQERLVQAFPMRYLFRFEAEHLLVRAGFSVREVYSDYDKSPYGSRYPGEIIIVAGLG
ncbi:MAG: class I SAM-dependent methyltransferase [Anaerolineae bacterium]